MKHAVNFCSFVHVLPQIELIIRAKVYQKLVPPITLLLVYIYIYIFNHPIYIEMLQEKTTNNL